MRFLTATILLTASLLYMVDHGIARQLYFNEIMSSNSSTISDKDGDYPDWIEIVNFGDEPIGLEGYGLSDDYEQPHRWVFPDVTIQPDSYLLIWASNKDRSVPGSGLHTNFAIDAEGEEVILSHPDGTLVDELAPTEIPTDVSIGRLPDGTGEWVYFDEPTPGESNSSEPILGLLDPPVFSHEPGFYKEEFELSITHPQEDVTIYYTLDGSKPTTSSIVYSSPIAITNRNSDPNRLASIPTNLIQGARGYTPPKVLIPKANIVRVKAMKDNYLSTISSGSFFVFQEGSGKHQLPVISISTNKENLFDDEIGIYVPGNSYVSGIDTTGNFYGQNMNWEREASLEFFDANGNLGFTQDVGLRIHGGFSRRFPQKSLRVYARSVYGENRINYHVFNNQSDESYNRLILRNSGNDYGQTMFRDALAQTIMRHFDMDTQAYEPSVVYINGEYWGIHNIRELYNRHYLERTYGIDPENIDLLTYHTTVKEGSHWHYQNLINFVQQRDLRDETNFQEIWRRMDLNNYLDYFTAQIYLINTDWPHNNIDFWRLKVPYDPDAQKGHDGRWRWLMYDVDYSFNYHPDIPIDFDMLEWVTAPRNFANQSWPNLLFRHLLNNDTFRVSFINRMADHLNSSFLPDRVLGIIDKLANVVEPEMEKHINRWNAPNNMNWWNGYVNIMRQFARDRPKHMRQNIMDHFSIESTSNVTVNLGEMNEGEGSVYINSLHIHPDTEGLRLVSDSWTGTYFTGIPIRLKAEPKPGFRFSHWILNHSGKIIHEEEVEILPDTIQEVTPVFKSGSLEFVDSYPISEEFYLFSEWDLENRAGRYPESMVFVLMNEDDPGPEAVIYGVVTGAYDHESRTRIEGHGDRGFAFINTSHPDGNPGYPGTRLGGAVLAINTEHVNNAVVGWRAGTLEPNSKVYHFRLQYRTDPDEPFQDLLDQDGNIIEYESNEQAGHSQFIGPYPLPEDAIDAERVELLWRYYYTGVQHDPESDQRSKLNISTIYVANSDLYPDLKPYSLTGNPYLFENWTSNHPAGSYPESMSFVFMDEIDPGLNSKPLGHTTGVYDLDSKTRINGLGDDGFSFVNTADLEGNPGYPGRRLGGAILSLNTQKQGSTMVEWAGGTVDPGSRIYHLRLQYRIGSDGEFQDVMDRFGNVVEYRRSDEAGHSEQIGPVLLPPETDDQPEVQLMWKYYYTGVQEVEESGERSQLNISRIKVWAQPLMGGEPGEPKEFMLYQNYPNPFYPQSMIRYDLPQDQHVKLDLYTITGQHIQTLEDGPRRAGRHSVPVNASSLASGIYVYRLVTDDYNSSGKLSVIK